MVERNIENKIDYHEQSTWEKEISRVKLVTMTKAHGKKGK